MKQKTILILSAATVAILFACGSTHEFYSVEIVDGVRTVHNIKPLWGDEPKIQLELVQVIGGLDAEDENFQLYRPYDIAIDHDGNRYLLDSGNDRVQKFDLNWNYVSSFGQKGQGPGDISFARQLQFDIDGDLHVLESGNSRVQVFSTDSKSIRIYKSGGFRNEFSLLNSGLIAGNGYLGGLQTLSREQRLNLQDVDFPNLYIYDQKGSIIRKIGKERKYEARGMKALGNYSSVTFDREDNLYIAFDSRNLIEKFTSDGKSLLRIDRATAYEESMEAETIREQRGDVTVIYGLVNKFSNGIQLDSKGRIWVMSYNRQPTQEERNPDNEQDAPDLVYLEVYDKEGILLTRIPIEFGISREFKRIINDHVYFIDSQQEMAVYEYKIVEK